MPNLSAPAQSIAVIAHAHPDYSKGGSEIAAYNLFRALRAMGLNAIYITVTMSAARRVAWNEADHEYFLFVEPDEYDWFFHLGSPRTAVRIEQILKACDVKTVFVHHFMHLGINTLASLRRRNFSVYLTLHEFLSICHNHGQMVTNPLHTLCSEASTVACLNCFPEIDPSRLRMREWHFRTVLTELNGLISPSRFLKNRFVEWGISDDRIAVIENGLDPARLEKNREPETRRDAFLTEDTVTVGYFGQINPFKGVDLLVAAAERLEAKEGKGARVVLRVHGNIVSLSDEFQRRLETAQASGSHFQYVGPYANDKVVDLMRACDYVVMPSRWWENSTVVIQEAYASGRPVIVGDIGGMAEKVPNMKTGLQFTHNSLASFLSVLEKATDPALYKQLCHAIPTPPDSLAMAKAYLAWHGVRAGERAVDSGEQNAAAFGGR